MSLLCKIFGHNIEVQTCNGLNPGLMKVIHRRVQSCRRCDYIKREDSVLRDYNSKQGLNIWGSGGMCHGCKNASTCKHKPNFAGVWVHCPINNFEIIDSEIHRLKNWGNILIG